MPEFETSGGRYVSLDGRGSAYVREFDGPAGAPTLMLLHGLSATGKLNWGPSVGALREHFNVVSIDQRGHGRGVRGKFTLDDCADDAVAIADALGLDTFIPVGYSMGGPISQLIWHRYPERVDGLVMCATARNFGRRPGGSILIAGFPVVASLTRMTPGVARRFVMMRVLERVAEPEARDMVREEMGNSDPAALLEAAGELAKFSSAAWITGVDVPAAVVVTAKDSVVPPVRQYKLAGAIPTATTFEVNGDHAVCIAAPGRFVPVLVEACRDVAARIDDGERAAASD